MILHSFSTFLLLLITASSSEEPRPCIEISRELRFPCSCMLGPIEQALDGNPSISVNCDRIVFSSEVPSLPYGAPIVSFSQRWAGHQSLPTQVNVDSLETPPPNNIFWSCTYWPLIQSTKCSCKEY